MHTTHCLQNQERVKEKKNTGEVTKGTSIRGLIMRNDFCNEIEQILDMASETKQRNDVLIMC